MTCLICDLCHLAGNRGKKNQDRKEHVLCVTWLSSHMLSQTKKKSNNILKERENIGAQTAAILPVSPAGVICFVQVSVRKSILPVQYSAHQLSSVWVKKTQSYLEMDRGTSFQYEVKACVYLQALSPLDRITSQWRPVGFSPITPITFSLTYCLKNQDSYRLLYCPIWSALVSLQLIRCLQVDSGKAL